MGTVDAMTDSLENRPEVIQLEELPPIEPCPHSGSVELVRPKEMLIGAESPRERFNGEEKAGYRRMDQLAVDECKPELLKKPPLQ